VQLLDAAGSGQSQYSCQFDTFPGLSIQSSLPASLALNQSATLTFNGFGGQPPYRWSVNGPPWLSPNQSGALLQLVGAPPSADPFDCTVTLTDSIGSAPAKANCALPVREPGLQIAGAVCPSTPSFLGRPYALTVNATGGAGPYTWVFRGPGFLTPTTPSTGTVFTISGTPDRPGEFDYSIELRDAAGIVQTFACKLTVIVPPIPQIQIVGLNLTADLLQDITVGIQLSEPTPIPLEIELQLNFISTAPGVTDNPQVQFLDPTATNSGKRLRFFIPQGSSASSTARIRGGTIAGIIRIQVFTVSTGGVAIDAANRPSRDVTIPSIRPVITDLQFTDETAGGFTLVISGFSTPRDMSQLIVTLTPRAGGSLNGTTTFTIPLTDLFRTYFNSAASLDVGSGFVLRLPITIQGDKAQVGAVSIQLSNSVGQSDTFTRNR
jgi:hypothetical protein